MTSKVKTKRVIRVLHWEGDSCITCPYHQWSMDMGYWCGHPDNNYKVHVTMPEITNDPIPHNCPLPTKKTTRSEERGG